jgi:hypothetical protein
VSATATAAAPDPVRSRKPATVAVDSWWRGLPARAWTTSLRRNGRTAGRMPTAPWEASSHAWRSQSSLKKKRHANDRNATGETTGTAPVGPATRLTSLRPFSCTAGPENRVLFGAREAAYRRAQQPRLTSGTQGTGCRASAGRSPGEGEPVLFQRCPATARAQRRTRWKRAPEKCVTATKQAVETPGGGRIRPSTTNTTRHRRAASRSGGATSAERDGRPVERRTEYQRPIQGQQAATASGPATADNPGPVTVTGNRARPSDTGSDSDRAASEQDEPQRQGQRQGQRQLQQTAAHPRCRGRQRGTDSAGHSSPLNPAVSNPLEM